MKWLGRVVVVSIAYIVGIILIWGVLTLRYYGAVTPCGIAQKMLEKQAVAQLDGSSGAALGVQLGMLLVSRKLQETSEWECFQMLPRINAALSSEQTEMREHLGNNEYRSVDWEIQLCRRALVAYKDYDVKPPSYIRLTCQDVLERQVTGAKWKNEAQQCQASVGKDLVLCLEPIFR